jgi:hypothetical protein
MPRNVTTQKSIIYMYIHIEVKTSNPTYNDFFSLVHFHVLVFNFIYTPIPRLTNLGVQIFATTNRVNCLFL